MSHFKFSMFFGIVFPVIYFVIILSVICLIDVTAGFESLPKNTEWMLTFPISWAAMLYESLFGYLDAFEFVTARYLLWFAGGNFLLYFSIGNFLWKWRENRLK